MDQTLMRLNYKAKEMEGLGHFCLEFGDQWMAEGKRLQQEGRLAVAQTIFDLAAIHYRDAIARFGEAVEIGDSARDPGNIPSMSGIIAP